MPLTSDSNFSFVHAADLHLDTPFNGVHEVAPSVARALREASLDTFDAIVELALDRDAAFFLVAGDVYDGAERGLRAQLRFRDGLGRLSDAGIPSFVVHGNHDPVVDGWSAIGSSWPAGVTVFRSDEVTVVPIHRDGTRVATVQGISYANRVTTENLALRLQRPTGDGVHIGLLHCNLDGGTGAHANYSPCSIEDLERTGLDYLALGHIHQRRILTPHDGPRPWIVYPGNSQARSPRASERGPKGAVVGHVTAGAITDVEFVACDGIRFEEIEIDMTDLADLGELDDRLADATQVLLDRADGRSVLARGRIVGRGRLHADLARPGAVFDLLARRREEVLDGERFCWWDELADESLGEIDRSTIRSRGDFSTDLLELAEQIEDDVDLQRAIASDLVGDAPRFFSSRLDDLIRNDEQLATLVRQATGLAIDELSTDAK